MKKNNTNKTGQVFQTNTDARIDTLEAGLRQQVSVDTVPSGILPISNSWNKELDALNGTESSPAITQIKWLNIFNLLTNSTVLAADATSVDMTARSEPFWADGVVPIYIADFAYERLRPRVFVHARRILKSPVDESVSIPQLSKVVEHSNTFFASALLPPDYDLFTQIAGKHYGKRVKFVVPASGYKTNTGRLIESIDLSFDDGTLLKIRPDETIEHEFADYGTKQITLSLHTLDGDTRVANFSFDVAARTPQPDATWLFNDSAGNLAATAWVYYARNTRYEPIRNKIEKPVLLSEGFPGGRTIDQLWPLVNQEFFATELLVGYERDFIILGFKDGTRKIQENAIYYEDCIKRLIAEKKNNEKIAAGGASMGGLIARYALCKMEKDQFDHHVNVFFTVDTPHEGANIPVSVQAFVQLYAAKPCGGAAEPSARLLASPAAQQMLLQWVPPYSQWVREKYPPIASPERQLFLKDLFAVGWMPRKARRIGVADGVGTGVGNGVPSGAQAVKFEISVCHWAGMYASEEEKAKIVVMQNGSENWVWVFGGQRIDGAPGGTRDTWQETFNNLPDTAKRNWVKHPNHCFVPTVSACAVKSNDLYIKDVERLPSELDAFKVSSTTNLEHVKLTPELKTFLVENITRP